MTEQQTYQNSTPLLRSLTIQGRVIGALLMREILTRFGRHNIGFMWLFVEPMIFTLGIATLWSFVKLHHSSSFSIVAFAVTGYSSVLLWRNTVNHCLLAITPNLSLMYHRNVRVIDVYASRIVLEMGGATISFFVLSVIFIFIGWMNPPVNILEVMFGWLMLMWFGAALAITMGALSERSEVVEKLWSPITYLIFPLSGAAFMVEWLPQSMRGFVLWLPMVHGVEIVREGYFGAAVRAHYDLAYMVTFCLCLTFIGLALARETGRRVEPE